VGAGPRATHAGEPADLISRPVPMSAYLATISSLILSYVAFDTTFFFTRSSLAL
jgi:hypothetical protein